MAHLPALIIDLALILGAAAVFTLLFKRLKQPLVLGYIIAGLVVGPNFSIFPTVLELDSIKIWADIGVIVLLFSLGLEFSFKKLAKVGGVALITAFCGVGLTMLMGYELGILMGWNNINSLFMGGILAIASTTIIIRAFDELGVKTKKFTGVVFGVLIIEDLVAVLLMVILSTVSISKQFEGTEMLLSVSKLAFFLVLWFVSGIFFLPTLLKRLKNLMNEETLLIVSLGLCFLMVVLATEAGFSPALGAFIMGSILAETPKAEKIEHTIKSLKSLFGAIFFVSVGMLIELNTLVEYAWPILFATLILLIGKPLFVTLGSLSSGLPLKVAIQSGMSLSQIGEFSFIIAGLGLSLGVTADFLYPIAVAVSVLTTFTTPYMIKLSEPVYTLVERLLPERWVNRLNNYSSAAQRITHSSDWQILLRAYLINVIVLSVIIITIILLSTEYLLPLLSDYKWSHVLASGIVLMILSPFLWALAFRRTQKVSYANLWAKPFQRGPLIVMMLARMALAVFYVGFLLKRYFNVYAALGGGIVMFIVLLFFSRKIQRFYGKIESRFLLNLNERDLLQAASQTQQALAPWDTHIAKIELNANSPYTGKTLSESRIREDFGVNIAIIERGDEVITVPSRHERLYPNDVLSVIGTDEQLQTFISFLNSKSGVPEEKQMKPEISLEQFVIPENSSLVGSSIRDSAIRELAKGLVVGIERNGQRILNPESDLVFEANDKIWIVGNEKRIRVLAKQDLPPASS